MLLFNTPEKILKIQDHARRHLYESVTNKKLRHRSSSKRRVKNVFLSLCEQRLRRIRYLVTRNKYEGGVRIIYSIYYFLSLFFPQWIIRNRRGHFT